LYLRARTPPSGPWRAFAKLTTWVIPWIRDAGAADKALVQYAGNLHKLLRESGREAIPETIFDCIRARIACKLLRLSAATFR
jgi:hypothetical protein